MLILIRRGVCVFILSRFTSFFSLALISIILFSSCKDQNITSGNKKDILKISEIGFYHNEALSMVFNDKNINLNDLKYSDFKNLVINKLSTKYSDKFNKKLLRKDVSIIDEQFLKSIMVKSNSLHQQKISVSKSYQSFNGDFQSLFSKMKNNDKISQKFYSRLIQLYSNKKDWFNSDDPVTYAKDVIARKTLANSDKKYAEAFLSILKSSYHYWNQNSMPKSFMFSTIDPVIKAGPDGCTVAPYAADVTGGLYGMLAGPAWSVIEAGIFSAWTAVSCADQ